jgi:phosphoenolpyruvate carboxykinase (ATP)
MLEDRVRTHGAQVWLVNTGWTGGPYGVGKRFPLDVTRRLVRAVLTGALDGATFAPDPVFNVLTPTACPDVPSKLLQPRHAWPSGDAYDRQARHLAELFRTNFKAHEAQASPEVRQAGPM